MTTPMNHLKTLPFLLCFASIWIACGGQRPNLSDPKNDQIAKFNHSSDVLIHDCQSCHSQDLPRGKVGNPNFDHLANGGLGDCLSCHQQAAIKNKYSSWVGTGVGFNHSNVVTCQDCHLDSVSPSTTYPANAINNKFIHKIGRAGRDCNQCHGDQPSSPKWIRSNGANPESAPLNNLGVSWAGGVFDHLISGKKVNSCGACHPSTYDPTHGHPAPLQYHYMAFFNNPCLTCHGVANLWPFPTKASSTTE